MKRNAQAHWTGDLKTGKGTVTTESGALKALPYSFATRFEGDPGTNPEELIGAALAGCYAMATSAFLNKAGFAPETLDANASVQLSQVGEGWEIDAIDLTLDASIPNIEETQFQAIAKDAKEQCPISQLLKAPITLKAKLSS